MQHEVELAVARALFVEAQRRAAWVPTRTLAAELRLPLPAVQLAVATLVHRGVVERLGAARPDPGLDRATLATVRIKTVARCAS